MPEFHYASFYIAAAVWLLQRAFTRNVDQGHVFRSTFIAACIGAVSLFIPMRSGMMAALLCAAFLAGVMALTVLLGRHFGGWQRTFSGTLLVQFGLMFLAMVLMAAPLVLIARLGQY